MSEKIENHLCVRRKFAVAHICHACSKPVPNAGFCERCATEVNRAAKDAQERAKEILAHPTCQWVKTSERLPECGKVVLVHFLASLDYNSHTASLYIHATNLKWTNDEDNTCPNTPNYWLDAPEPPAPVDEAEESFSDWISQGNPTTQSAFESFKAGFRAGKQSK